MSEEDFNLAANYIQSNHQNFSKGNLLNFYAFYKQITVGPLDPAINSKPSFFLFNERAKWEAWYALGVMSETEARIKYIDLLTNLNPEWNINAIDNKSVSGVAVSRPKFNEEVLNEEDKTIEDFIREGNVEKIQQFLNSIPKDEINKLDTNNQMGVLHWAADRGNQKILELILSQQNIDINLVDGEKQTALHYACCCGHYNCVRLLLEKGADKNILDIDGNKCIDVAFDDEIKKLLC